MRKISLLVVTILLLTLAATAQQSLISYYQVNFYSNRNNSAGADQVTRIINTGTVGSPLSQNEGRLCADLYIFDSTQEMIECCGCSITANGMRTFSLLKDLTQNPLTGFPAPDNGVIKLVTARQTGKTCDPTAVTPNDIFIGGFSAWQTHVEQPTSGTFVNDISQFDNSLGSLDELGFLVQACSFVQYLGSGKGVCQCGVGS